MLKSRLIFGGLAVAAVVSFGTSARAGIPYKVLHNEPDDDRLHIAGSLYYALIGKNFLNFGGHGQATVVVAPALELQGTGMVNFPGSGTSFLRAEGSAYLAIPWMSKGRINLSSYSTGNYTITEYVEVPDVERAKFGIEGGLYFDRHGTRVITYEEKLTPVTSVGAFIGLKWVRQANFTTALDGYGQYSKQNRVAYYVHIMRAISQAHPDVGPLPSDMELKKGAFGARFGMEAKFTGVTAFFLKYEAGAMPSIGAEKNLVDFNMFIFLGAQHSRGLF